MFERLGHLLSESFGANPESIRPETRLRDLLRDSLDLLEWTMLIEEDDDLSLPDEVAASLDLETLTVGQLAVLLEQHRP
jgi:acyl carrier protein